MILIRQGTVHDGLGQVLENTDVLVDGGQIVKIGTALDSAGAEVVEAAGKCVMPGWIDPLSGWGTAAGRGQARDNDETSDPITPQLEAYYAFDPESVMYQQLWGYGITAVGVAPSNNNVLGGTLSVFKTWGTRAETMCVRENCAMKGSADDQVKAVYGARNAAPMTKMGIFSALRDMLRLCASEKEDDQKNPKVKAMKPVLEGSMPLIMSCNTRAEMDGVLKVMSSTKAHVVLSNVYQLDESLKTRDCDLILGDLTDGFNRFNGSVNFKALFELMKSGRKVALSAFGDAVSPGREILMWNAQRILAEARRTHADITSEDVLKMLTSIPAEMLQAAGRIGSLQEGRDADIIVWSQNPLETFQARPETVMISGTIIEGGPQA